MRCDCGCRLGKVKDIGISLDLWNVIICSDFISNISNGNQNGGRGIGDEGLLFSVTEVMVSFMLHHISQQATHKFLLTAPVGPSLLVLPNHSIANLDLGIFDGCGCFEIRYRGI